MYTCLCTFFLHSSTLNKDVVFESFLSEFSKQISFHNKIHRKHIMCVNCIIKCSAPNFSTKHKAHFPKKLTSFCYCLMHGQYNKNEFDQILGTGIFYRCLYYARALWTCHAASSLQESHLGIMRTTLISSSRSKQWRNVKVVAPMYGHQIQY